MITISNLRHHSICSIRKLDIFQEKQKPNPTPKPSTSAQRSPFQILLGKYAMIEN